MITFWSKAMLYRAKGLPKHVARLLQRRNQFAMTIPVPHISAVDPPPSL